MKRIGRASSQKLDFGKYMYYTCMTAPKPTLEGTRTNKRDSQKIETKGSSKSQSQNKRQTPRRLGGLRLRRLLERKRAPNHTFRNAVAAARSRGIFAISKTCKETFIRSWGKTLSGWEGTYVLRNSHHHFPLCPMSHTSPTRNARTSDVVSFCSATCTFLQLIGLLRTTGICSRQCPKGGIARTGRASGCVHGCSCCARP